MQSMIAAGHIHISTAVCFQNKIYSVKFIIHLLCSEKKKWKAWGLDFGELSVCGKQQAGD